ncbi:hypothetical protein HMPREF9714_00070 [Myroides odoratimimus CCUG 12901]|uniref:Uncharacterized protein n=1 Tax=Myroides odoratimimus CIP 101113 TaxID=883154 RepID=A0AAV3F7P5_9FLAO|nr:MULTISPECIES: hypothetical protein [Myroides]EHO15313.1 hypothetical protein HMPREF9714_00070 [Myroides odoratimimus CCUG 12901]EHO15503.1 hypothetical protein HMPREF9715_00074 [Myroides odoratimimus CIP 101113]EKB04780.1 hypothetical protein HMPREF9711_01645 [Myroides odoratimimus CCUG 3837]MDM1510130.1 hypothetical protein [Myroides odoratimimus]MDM1526795.1 hypothetical protein [Myroides odoratimimus]
MNRLIVMLILVFGLNACGQQPNKVQDKLNPSFVEKTKELFKEVKVYDDELEYILEVKESHGCTYEVLVNGFPVLSHYASGVFTGNIPINQAIVKSGVQKVEVIVTPSVDVNYVSEKSLDLSKTKFDFNIVCQNKNRESTTVHTYSLPKHESSLMVFEDSFVFDAPYVYYEHDVQHWMNSVDLQPEDRVKLLKEVEIFYNEIIELLSKGEAEHLARIAYQSQRDYHRYSYLKSSSYASFLIDFWKNSYKTKEIEPLKDYEMRFYANGRIVRLVRIDKENYNKSPLILVTREGGGTSFYEISLHRPKEGGALEVIR